MPLQIEYDTVAVEELQTFENNPRRGNIRAIADSLHRTGQYRPIVVNRGAETGRPNEVLAGNHTLLAARSLGWGAVDVGFVDVDEQTARRIVVADNRTADLGGYDDESLAELIESLDDLVGTGYSAEDYDALVAGLVDKDGDTDPDDAPPLPDGDENTESQVGEVWELGPHRLLVGDATDTEAVLDMLDGDRPTCVWTDPPYGVEYVGKTKDALRIRNDGAAGLPDLLMGAFTTLAAVAEHGAPIYVAHADTERITFQTAMEQAGLIVRQNLVWVKSVIVMGGSDYHYKHEPILEASAPDPNAPSGSSEGAAAAQAEDDGALVDAPREHTPLLYGFTPGAKGRLGRGGERWHGDNKQSTVFDFDKPSRSTDHPTMKPVALILAMLENSLRPGGTVLDLFAGSGSTMIAAHRHGSAARLVELDPRYADVICRRYQEHTGVVPIRRSTGEPVSFTRNG